MTELQAIFDKTKWTIFFCIGSSISLTPLWSFVEACMWFANHGGSAGTAPAGTIQAKGIWIMWCRANCQAASRNTARAATRWTAVQIVVYGFAHRSNMSVHIANCIYALVQHRMYRCAGGAESPKSALATVIAVKVALCLRATTIHACLRYAHVMDAASPLRMCVFAVRRGTFCLRRKAGEGYSSATAVQVVQEPLSRSLKISAGAFQQRRRGLILSHARQWLACSCWDRLVSALFQNSSVQHFECLLQSACNNIRRM